MYQKQNELDRAKEALKAVAELHKPNWRETQCPTDGCTREDCYPYVTPEMSPAVLLYGKTVTFWHRQGLAHCSYCFDVDSYGEAEYVSWPCKTVKALGEFAYLAKEDKK